MWEPRQYKNGSRWKPSASGRESLVNTRMAVGENLLKGGMKNSWIIYMATWKLKWKTSWNKSRICLQVQWINSGLTGDAVNKFIGAVNNLQWISHAVYMNFYDVNLLKYSLQVIHCTYEIIHCAPGNIHCTNRNIHKIFTAHFKNIHEIFTDIFIEIFTEVFTEISTAPIKIFTTHSRGVHTKFIPAFT